MSLDSATPRQIIGTWREVLNQWNRGYIFDNESILQVQRLFYVGVVNRAHGGVQILVTRVTLTLTNDRILILDLAEPAHFRLFKSILCRENGNALITNGSFEGRIDSTEVVEMEVWRPDPDNPLRVGLVLPISTPHFEILTRPTSAFLHDLVLGEGTPIHRASIRTPTLRPHTTTLTRTRKRPSGIVGFVASKKKVRTEGESTAVPRSETGQFNLQKTLLERSEKYGVDITGLDIDDPIPEPTVRPPPLVIPRRRTLKDLKIIGTVSNK